MNISDSILEDLKRQEIYYGNEIKSIKEDFEDENHKLTARNSFIFRIIKGIINALEKLLDSNETRYSMKQIRLSEKMKEELKEYESRYFEVKSLISIIEKDS